MSKEIYISSTPHETRLAIVEKDELSEIYYERENEYTLAGSIYNGRVTRVLPGMQSSFVDIGLERDAFLYITDFLEEQDESADFDGAGGSPREARPERSSEARPERSSEGRPERSGEGRRERSGRGGRDARGGDREERPRREVRDTRPEGSTGTGEPNHDANSSFAPQDSGVEPGEPRGTEAELGEGAPGADGSRRWRGRRGRRRGRGADEPTSAAGAPDQTETLDSLDASDGSSESSDTRGSVETSAARDPESRQEVSREASGREGFNRESRRERGGRGGNDNRGSRDAGRQGRGGRDREGGRGDRFAREAQPGRDRSASGDNSEASDDRSPAVEPFILPGESLARYRRGADGEPVDQPGAGTSSRGAQEAVLARPSTEFHLTAAWDGGSTLPGETLSRHKDAPRNEPRRSPASAPQEQSQADFAPQTRTGFVAGGDRRRERDQRRGRRPDRPALDAAAAVQPAVTSQHEPETTAAPFATPYSAPFSDDAPSFELQATEERQEFEAARAQFEEPLAYEPQTDLAPAAAEPSPELLEAVEEFHETVAEYEPGDDASASFRVDPAAPSEFRQDSLVADGLDPVEARFDEGEQGHGADTADHEFTAVQSSGEMISEFPLVPEAVADASLEAQLSAPIEHETAVQSVHLDAAEATPFPADANGSAESADPRAFSPGSGALEEELMEDEDGDPLALHASLAGFDDMEEETLEGAADLGVMLRDMAVDDITRPDPVELDDEEDDDFDLDIDDMEEDELDSSTELAGSDFSELEEDEFAEAGELAEEAEFTPGVEGSDEPNGAPHSHAGNGQPTRARRGRGRRGDRDARPVQRAEGGQEREQERGADLGHEPSREQSRDQAADRSQDRGDVQRDGRRERSSRDGRRPSGRSGGRMSRHTAQTTDLPAISDLLKPGQELLVQIAKEPIAKKGARITSHIALPGRFLVFMPTVKHVGVSRKIESDAERRRLKEILLSEKGEAQGGFIVRTAASGASEEELRSDLRFLLNLWTDIKQRSEGSKSPALIYHDLNLVERVLRDQVTDTFSAIWVDTETEYERVLRFLQRFQPSLIRRVKLYSKDTPLFEQFGITEEINKALRSKVWLKSGGSIVINQTEALVAIDINTGKFVGKTARLEDTIVKTNLDAIPEIVRQIRLRDLGGIIVIDFIDMDDRKNRHKVLAVLEEELKKDRAPSKVLQFNDFGLVAITRKRVKQSLERTLSSTCTICAGTGMTKSPVTVCNEIYTEMRKMHRTLDKGDVMLRVNPEVVKQLKSNNARWLTDLEELSGKTILLKSDPSLHPEQFDIH